MCDVWKVIDMYLSWCGPCDCIEQNFRTLNAKHDGKVEFYTASEDVIPEDIKMKLKEGPLSCQPRFAIYAVSANILNLTDYINRMVNARLKYLELTSRSSSKQ